MNLEAIRKLVAPSECFTRVFNTMSVREHELEGVGNIIVSKTLFQELPTVEESGCIKREGTTILITVSNPPDISIDIGMKRDSVSDDVLEFVVNIILHGIVDLAS